MAKLTITFTYFSAFINHDKGTTVFLPTANQHDATISGPGIAGGSTVLTGTDVSVRNTGGGAVASGPPTLEMSGYLTPLTCMLPDARTRFDRGLLIAPLQASRFNARFSLPWGTLKDHPMQRDAFRDVIWNFGNNCHHKATDQASYTYDLPVGATYELVIGDTAIPLVNDATYVVENGDELLDGEECPSTTLSDPYPLEEFKALAAALGLVVSTPMGPLPESLKQYLDQVRSIKQAVVDRKLIVAAGADFERDLRICQPCPKCMLDLF